MTALIVTICAASVLWASPALAHGGTGGDSSDYRTTITGYVGDPSGVDLRVVQLGDSLRLDRTGADEVVILGYEGEPYRRLDAEGVWENVRSPAHFLNASRFGSEPPDDMYPDAEPSWVKLSSSTSTTWHDHRAHWMSPTPLSAVTDDPDVERVVHTDQVDMIIDGRTVSAAVEITWLPKPDRLLWLVSTSVLGAIVTAVLVLVPRVRRLGPLVVVAAAFATAAGQGQSTTRIVIGLVLIAAAVLAAIVAARSRKPLLAVVVAVGAAALAVTRLEVFEHQLLAGWLNGSAQRVAIVAALSLALGSVAASVVSALGETPDEV